jgi:hypothetical protein
MYWQLQLSPHLALCHHAYHHIQKLSVAVPSSLASYKTLNHNLTRLHMYTIGISKT